MISEAAVAGVPVLASRVDGNVGLLGADYPGKKERKAPQPTARQGRAETGAAARPRLAAAAAIRDDARTID